jgi:hypothetical protein
MSAAARPNPVDSGRIMFLFCSRESSIGKRERPALHAWPPPTAKRRVQRPMAGILRRVFPCGSAFGRTVQPELARDISGQRVPNRDMGSLRGAHPLGHCRIRLDHNLQCGLRRGDPRIPGPATDASQGSDGSPGAFTEAWKFGLNALNDGRASAVYNVRGYSEAKNFSGTEKASDVQGFWGIVQR